MSWTLPLCVSFQQTGPNAPANQGGGDTSRVTGAMWDTPVATRAVALSGRHPATHCEARFIFAHCHQFSVGVPALNHCQQLATILMRIVQVVPGITAKYLLLSICYYWATDGKTHIAQRRHWCVDGPS